MDKIALRALKGSIKKWEGIVAGTKVDKAIGNCPLCKAFWADGCQGCPVQEKTGQPGCVDSPYDLWTDVDPDRKLTPADVAALDVAKQELEFLRSLLPSKSSVIGE